MDTRINAEVVANYLQTGYVGKNVEITGVSMLSHPKSNTLLFAKKGGFELEPEVSCVIITTNEIVKETKELPNVCYILVDNPRLAFAKVVTEFFTKKNLFGIPETCRIGDSCSIDSSVSMGEYCVIGKNVSIGKNTILNNHVVIADNTIIGDNCYIKSLAVIGEEGFGFEYDENHIPVRLPHLGFVRIGNNVEIGSHSVIARGTIGETTICNNVKTDDHVFIAHNCHIGENTLIMASAEISGSTKIGKNCWIAPNSTIINKITIGDNVTVGIGALIINDIPSNTKYMGLESLNLQELRSIKKRLQYGRKY